MGVVSEAWVLHVPRADTVQVMYNIDEGNFNEIIINKEPIESLNMIFFTLAPL